MALASPSSPFPPSMWTHPENSPLSHLILLQGSRGSRLIRAQSYVRSLFAQLIPVHSSPFGMKAKRRDPRTLLRTEPSSTGLCAAPHARPLSSPPGPTQATSPSLCKRVLTPRRLGSLSSHFCTTSTAKKPPVPTRSSETLFHKNVSHAPRWTQPLPCSECAKHFTPAAGLSSDLVLFSYYVGDLFLPLLVNRLLRSSLCRYGDGAPSGKRVGSGMQQTWV